MILATLMCVAGVVLLAVAWFQCRVIFLAAELAFLFGLLYTQLSR